MSANQAYAVDELTQGQLNENNSVNLPWRKNRQSR